MRTIKFRAWDKDIKEWIPNDKWLIHPNGEFESLLIYGDLEVMQFTGLLDKNGKEIYESDIVKWTIDPKAQVTIIGDKQKYRGTDEVSWNYEMCGFVLLDKEYGGWDSLEGSIMEVLGNVWENPELIATSGGK